ncbi:MAG: M17 family peptidase N-terminal domain-containing protein, partial [Ignavibacteria bacterium]
MSANVSVAARRTVKADAIVVFVAQTERHFKVAEKALVSEIPHLLPVFASNDFTGKSLQTTLAYCGSSMAAPRIILVGLGETNTVKAETIRRAAAAAAKRAAASGCTHIAVDASTVNGLDAQTMAQAITEGSLLSQY